MSGPAIVAADSAGFFACDFRGYIRHWLVAGLRAVLYEGPPGDEDVLRREALDHSVVEPPPSATLHAPSPLGEPWRLRYPGGNFFVEFSAFHYRYAVLDSYAFVEVESAVEGAREARFWVAGAGELWVNDSHVTRFDILRYMNPDFQWVALPLRRGVNRLCVRLQCFGVRDTRTLFGLQLTDPAGIAVRVPGCAQLTEAAKWLDGVRTEGRDAVVSSGPAPAPAAVVIPGGGAHSWPAGSSHVSLDAARPFQLSVEIAGDGQTVRRSFEIPANRGASAGEPPLNLRNARLEFIAGLTAGGSMPRRGHLALLARRLLGRTSEVDESDFAGTLPFIERREDCADFALATLLRLESLGLATAAESAEIRRVALAFRYWHDEPGADAMWFWSENHSLLFHGCQLIGGNLYPGDLFSNSNRTGAAQAALGAAHCREWLDRVEQHGFEEHNSSTYLPITIGALLNVVDFSGDAEISRRASVLIDRLYEGLAAHAFQGIVVSPQGRVYRNVLYPGESGTQALLSDATPEARPEFLNFSTAASTETWSGDWVVYPASSPAYRPPARLAALMRDTVSKRYRQAGVEIVLHKTPAYLLTSVGPPPSARGTANSLDPGGAGYQQHLWQATLGPDCHVFVNHPGSSFDESKARPGYWYGNGILPRLLQKEGTLRAIFNIPDGSRPHRLRTAAEWFEDPFDLYCIPFTHAHWPADAFDRQEVRDHWLFGQKKSGCIGLWCSGQLKPHDDVLTDREFRAWAYRSAWMAVCGDLAEHGSFESFIESCLAREPEFDEPALALRVKGEEPLLWKT